MKRIRLSFANEANLQSLADTFLNQLENASILPGDPFDRHIVGQRDIMERINASPIAKESFVGSAQELKKRFAPGLEIACTVGDVAGKIVCCRAWVDASFESSLPAAAVAKLKAFFKSLGEGDLSEFN
jgi:hypothetical protein